MIASGVQTIMPAVAGGVGVGREFTYTFKIFEDAGIGVKVRETTTKVETILVLDTHFTVTGAGDLGGGKITLIPSSGVWVDADDLLVDYEIYLYFNPDVKQLTKFRDLGRNAPVRIEEALDRLTMLIQAFFTGIGDAARSIKLPSNVHPSEFNVELPSDFNSNEDNLIAVNAAKTGFKTISFAAPAAISYVPTTLANIGGGGSITPTALNRQHLRVQSTGAPEILANKLFGNNDAVLINGMEIVVEAIDPVATLQINEADEDYGFIGNGGIILAKPRVATFIYNADIKRFKLKANGAW